MEVKQVIRLVLKSLSDQVLLLGDRLVQRVLVGVELDLVVQVDELLKRGHLVMPRVLEAEAVIAQSERALNLVQDKVESRAGTVKQDRRINKRVG